MELRSASRIVLAVLAFHAGASAAAADDLIFADGFDECAASATRACYGGPVDTESIGVCQAGEQHCVAGSWGPCTAERTPVFESCNGLDDDCNGVADNGLGTISCGIGACEHTVAACQGGQAATCLPLAPGLEGPACDSVDNDCDGAVDEDCGNCVRVSPFGSDVTGDGSPALPFRTIGAAITRAAATGVPAVCVAAGASCISSLSTYAEAVTMANGVSIYGRYESSGWSRCGTTVTTIISNQTAGGVYFGPAVTSRTILDGFRIDRQAVPTTAAITVEGSTGASISNNVVTNAPIVAVSYGVNIIDSAGTPATPTLYRNAITGGGGTTLAAAVRSLNSAPVIQGHCPTIDPAGHCASFCLPGAPCLTARSGGTGAESYGVRLESSPGARVEANAIVSGGNSSVAAAGVRVSGAASGTVVRANLVNAYGADDIAGVWLEDCQHDTPWVFDNERIVAIGVSSQSRTDGVRAVGACHPRIDGNELIAGAGEGTGGENSGVRCGPDGFGTPSLCTITGNTLIEGSASAFPPDAVGVRCEGGACARIEGNGITGRGGQVTHGLILDGGGAFVDGNVIQAGCATSSGIGLLAVDSFARVQNNRIEGTAPASGCVVVAPISSAVVVSLGTGLNQVDLHSNDLVGRIGGGTCTSSGLAFDLAGAPPSGGRGLVRNNIVSAGTCSDNLAVEERDAAADPRVLQNNDLWSSLPPTALYRDEAGSNLTTISSVNALGDLEVSGNISADPLYTGANTLSSGSPCRDAGLLTGAPLLDFEGDMRPEGPACDIGRDEFTP